MMKFHFCLRVYGLGLAIALVQFMVVAAPAEPYAIAVPSPTGSYKVGTSSMRFVDLSRNDPYVRANNRELLIQLWYPASTVQGYHLVDYSSPKVWRYISQLTGVDLPPISTNSGLVASRRAAETPQVESAPPPMTRRSQASRVEQGRPDIERSAP